MTIDELCKAYQLTDEERRKVIQYLAFLRASETLALLRKSMPTPPEAE